MATTLDLGWISTRILCRMYGCCFYPCLRFVQHDRFWYDCNFNVCSAVVKLPRQICASSQKAAMQNGWVHFFQYNQTNALMCIPVLKFAMVHHIWMACFAMINAHPVEPVPVCLTCLRVLRIRTMPVLHLQSKPSICINWSACALCLFVWTFCGSMLVRFACWWRHVCSNLGLKLVRSLRCFIVFIVDLIRVMPDENCGFASIVIFPLLRSMRKALLFYLSLAFASAVPVSLRTEW